MLSATNIHMKRHSGDLWATVYRNVKPLKGLRRAQVLDLGSLLDSDYTYLGTLGF